MDCLDAQLHLLDYQRGRLAPELRGEVRAHLDGCPACRSDEAAERELTTLLERRLPRYPASPALKRQLSARWVEPTAARRRSRWHRWTVSLAPALAVAAALLVAIPLYYQRTAGPPGPTTAWMVGEAVNDHLRVLSGRRPLDIESGGMHQVRPWFQGRLDFAPVVSFAGDDAFPLRGGATEFFLDRRAAVFVYSRRLHTISLLVFRAEGLPWPDRGLQRLGPVQAYRTTARGFQVVLWRAGELGYALVSDLDATELADLASRLAAG
jgi:anti-sigma factor RsiW